MTDLPFISVVIPVYNGEGRIEHCLESLKAQDYPADRFEVIVADGMSTDRTVEIAKQFGAIVHPNPRKDQGAARNEVFKIVKGDLLVFPDDDCVLPPGWLSTGKKWMEDESIDALGGPTPSPDSASDFTKAVDLIFGSASSIGYSVQSGRFEPVEVTDLPGQNAIYRSDVLKGMAPIREDFAEDVDLHLRMVRKGHKLIFAPDFIAWHHKKDTPKKFFWQIRRFGLGRMRLNNQYGGVLRPVHWLVALTFPILVALFLVAMAVGLAGLFVKALAVGAVILFISSLILSRSLKVALWAIPVTVIFFFAWGFGVFTEIFFPMRIKRAG